MPPNTRTLKGQSYSTKRWANLAWPKGSKLSGFSTEIESGYNEVYEKRHKRIEERKAALLAKERQTKPEETAEAENTQPTAEVQPEEHTQTEEVAA